MVIILTTPSCHPRTRRIITILEVVRPDLEVVSCHLNSSNSTIIRAHLHIIITTTRHHISWPWQPLRQPRTLNLRNGFRSSETVLLVWVVQLLEVNSRDWQIFLNRRLVPL